ncbi:sulfatase-like hydrolase/transferase [Pedobacter nyackensis]|uniref:sulfatase-like hydrolase/transferase n=1 Tax=Pedobacter nyackensis TaxID=475255 RepID=UPI00292EF515|nr:sulfatase-like hydrolase/transferase [Pedobacter nyackensis]
MQTHIIKALFISLILAASAVKAQQVKPYNVLVILTDDQRFNTIRALGNKEIYTPNLDQLVKGGTTFTQAHIMGSLGGAVCAPSRAMLLTGRSVFKVHQDGGNIPPNEKTFPELFRENGYRTFSTGKWHSDLQSFNRSFASGDNIFFGGMHQEKAGGHWKPRLNHYDPEGQYKNGFQADKFSSICYADAAINFLNQPQDTPFLMYVAFTAPHDPRTPPEEFLSLYDKDKISLPGNFMPRHPFNNGELTVRDEQLLPVPRNPDSVKQEIAKYYAMITEVDHEIGRIMEALRKTGQIDHTIIVLAGDNGLAVGQHGLLGKQNLYDHSMRVPLIFSGPGIPVNKQTDALCYLTDVFPTLCKISNLPLPETVNGRPLNDAFTKNKFAGRDRLFLTYSNLQRAIIKDNKKLILYNVDGDHPVQLFDLSKDPLEINNLAGHKNQQQTVRSLTTLLGNEMRAYGDFCDLSKDNWGYPGSLKWKDAFLINP